MSAKVTDKILEERKVKALEKIASTLDNLTLWFEEIDKEEWGERLEWYLDLVRKNYLPDLEDEKDDA